MLSLLANTSPVPRRLESRDERLPQHIGLPRSRDQPLACQGVWLRHVGILGLGVVLLEMATGTGLAKSAMERFYAGIEFQQAMELDSEEQFGHAEDRGVRYLKDLLKVA